MPSSRSARGRGRRKAKLASPNFAVSSTRLSVRNLPPSIDEKALAAAALAACATARKKHGQPRLKQVKLVRDEERRDRTGQPRSRGFGFVEFDRHEHSLAALKRLGDNPDALADHGAKGRWLIVEFAVDNVQKLRLHELRRQRSSQPPRAERNRAEEEGKAAAAARRRRRGRGGGDKRRRPQRERPTEAPRRRRGRRRRRRATAGPSRGGGGGAEQARAPRRQAARARARGAEAEEEEADGRQGREAREEAHHERLVQQYREKITRTVLDPLRGEVEHCGWSTDAQTHAHPPPSQARVCAAGRRLSPRRGADLALHVLEDEAVVEEVAAAIGGADVGEAVRSCLPVSLIAYILSSATA